MSVNPVAGIDTLLLMHFHKATDSLAMTTWAEDVIGLGVYSAATKVTFHHDMGCLGYYICEKINKDTCRMRSAGYVSNTSALNMSAGARAFGVLMAWIIILSMQNNDSIK